MAKIFNRAQSRVGSYENGKIYDRARSRVGSYENGKIYDRAWSRIGSYEGEGMDDGGAAAGAFLLLIAPS